MKNVELRLLAELMKNSRRSDRDLAKALKVSQPTISRTVKKLEHDGYVKEYTAIPDFHKLGFEIMSVNFIKFKASAASEDIERMRKTARELESKGEMPSLLVMQGMGLGSDRIIIMLHKDYSSFSKLVSAMKDKASGYVEKFESFLVNLDDKTHHQALTLTTLARFLARRAEEEKNESTKFL